MEQATYSVTPVRCPSLVESLYFKTLFSIFSEIKFSTKLASLEKHFKTKP